MKIKPDRLTAFLRRPPPAVLVYGPDRGRVRETADAIAEKMGVDPKNPFATIWLDAADLLDNPARLGDEVKAYSLGASLIASPSVVRLQGVPDAVAPLFAELLEAPGHGNPVIAEAGELRPQSPLRQLFERDRAAAAVACYGDEGEDLEAFIGEVLGGHGLSASADALAYLAGNLGGDRLVTRRELEKLALYMGGPGPVSLEDAAACVGDSAAVSLEAVAYAVAGGDEAALDRALERALLEGNAAVSVLRAVGRHLMRLHLAAGLVAQGRPAEEAMAALKPRVIFKLAPRFRAQMRRWDAKDLGRALDLLGEAEFECKTTGLPAEAICGRILLRIAHAAHRPRAHP